VWGGGGGGDGTHPRKKEGGVGVIRKKGEAMGVHVSRSGVRKKGGSLPKGKGRLKEQGKEEVFVPAQETGGIPIL